MIYVVTVEPYGERQNVEKNYMKMALRIVQNMEIDCIL